MASCKLLIFLLIFPSLILHFASSSDQKVKRASEKEIMNANFAKTNEMFEYLSKKIEQLETNYSNENKPTGVHEIRIVSSNHEILKKIEEIEYSLKKMEKCEDSLEKLEKLKDILEHIEEFGDHLESIERIEENYMRIEELLLRLLNRSDSVNKYYKKANVNKSDVMFDMAPTSQLSSSLCEPNPCLHGGKCELASTGQDYYCTGCPKLRSGKHCENVNCTNENRCWKHRDTLYVVYETWLRWGQAEEKCAGEGMTLAMPKDKESVEFLVTELAPVYKCYPSNYLWMGLKRDTGRSEWRWVDGSPFQTDNHKGNMHLKSTGGSSFGLLALLGGDLGWRWIWGYDTAHFYPLCEIRHLRNN